MNDKIVIDGVEYVKVKDAAPECLLYHPMWCRGQNSCYVSKNLYPGNYRLRYPTNELKEYPAPAKWKPKRGDPVFVWDDASDETILVPQFYFHSEQDNGGCFTLSSLRCGERGAPWQHYRKYDPVLVGVPRGDWPPEEAE